MNWRTVDEVQPFGLIVVYRWRGFYVGTVDDSGAYITGKNLPDGYLGLVPDDLWLSICMPVESDARLK